MARRDSTPVTVSLTNRHKAFVDTCVREQRYATASEVIRAGLRALELEDERHMAWMRDRIGAARSDPRPNVSGADVLSRLDARIAEAVKDEGHQILKSTLD